jgi:hypothetical protein
MSAQKPLLDECIWPDIAIRESISDLATMQPSVIGSSNAPWGICATGPDFEPSLAYRSSYGKDLKVRAGGH